MSSTPTMSIQHCPDEILDMIFQLLPVQSPDKAPAALLPTILTCSRFYSIAKCHLIRIVCLQTAQSVNLFAAYLAQLTDTGAYGKALLPITHMAVFGEYRNQRGDWGKRVEETERLAERILPFIISIAAPSLRSLTVFGFDVQYEEVDGRQVKVMVEPSVCFPKLQRLVLLEQHIITLHRREGQNEYSPSHCYPQLTSLYTQNRNVNKNVLGLRTLRELRLDMLIDTSDLPSTPIPHVETIIIDSPSYEWLLLWGGHQTWSEYDEKIESCHAFIKANSSSPESSVVVARGLCVRPEFVLDVWKDIVQGGSGCWKKGRTCNENGF